MTLAVDPLDPPAIVEIADDLVTLRFPGVDVALQARGAVVLVVDHPSDALIAAGRPLGASRRTWLVPSTPADVVAASVRWSQEPGVRSAIPDLVGTRVAKFNDPRYASQWYLERLEMQALYDVSLGDPEVRVAVVDSAIDLDHPDLVGSFTAPYDAYDDDDDPRPNPGEFCSSGNGLCDEHGTAVAGIVGARANNAEGIVGLCPGCTLVPIKLLGDGVGALSSDVAAFEHAIEANAAVINNSWGYIDPTPVPDALADVIHRAATEPRGGLGAVVVFAAGNDDRELDDDEVEALADVLCVGATDIYGNPTAYTNVGNALDVAAPSATVTTTVGGGYTETFGGTSAAAPVVAGLAGWIVSVAPTLSASEVHALIVETAVESPLVTFDENGHHEAFGYGNVSPAAILAALFPAADTDEETRRACGCAASTSGLWPLSALLGLLARRRTPRDHARQ